MGQTKVSLSVIRTNFFLLKYGIILLNAKYFMFGPKVSEFSVLLWVEGMVCGLWSKMRVREYILATDTDCWVFFFICVDL